LKNETALAHHLMAAHGLVAIAPSVSTLSTTLRNSVAISAATPDSRANTEPPGPRALSQDRWAGVIVVRPIDAFFLGAAFNACSFFPDPRSSASLLQYAW
jgi:hypothetical protein